MQAHHRTEHHREKEPRRQKMSIGITKQRHATAFKRIPEWKLMVLANSPICDPLGSQNLIPVVNSTRNRQMENQWVAKDHRKGGAPNGNCNRLSPGETSAIEQDVRQF